jgi:hypothetical protein
VKRGRENRQRAVALIMAVAIMAALAVIGFGFASSMKIQHFATTSIRARSQAQMAALAAIELFPGVLITDAMSAPGGTAGGVADHYSELLCTQGLSRVLTEWGNLSVMADTGSQPCYDGSVAVRDESSKMNLNAFGNISKWNYAELLNDTSNLDAVNADAQLYHGKNQRYSSFEVSFEEFFYRFYKDQKIWADGQPHALTDADADKKARVRCANLARAICLYRYGGRRDNNADGTPDYQGDGKPGTAGQDDDKDNDFGNNGVDDDRDGNTDATDGDEVGFGALYDRFDNDGDGQVDETDEGIDEPDEFNAARPAGDDEAIASISEFAGCVGNEYTLDGGLVVPAACNYTGAMSSADIQAEATRLFSVIKSELTVYSYSLDVRSVSIDDPGRDGYDNDGDGSVDADDVTGATTIDEIVDQLDPNGDGTWEKTIYEVDIAEADINKAAQAAYIYLKLKYSVDYEGGTPGRLVEHFGIKHALHTGVRWPSREDRQSSERRTRGRYCGTPADTGPCPGSQFRPPWSRRSSA